MSLTLEQRREALLHYQNALHNTQVNYLRSLDNFQLVHEDRNKIWNVNFTLQYMMDNHKKYIRMLELLQQDKRAQEVLNRLCEKLTIDPTENLQGFIDQAQTIMQNDDFKSEFTALIHAYRVEALAYLLGSIITAVAGISAYLAAPAFLPLLPAIALMVAGVLVGGLVAPYLIQFGFSAASDKADDLSRATRSLTRGSDTCDLRIRYPSYQQDNDTSFTHIAVRQGKSTNMLRDNFFKVQSDRSLAGEVQEAFNSLMPTTGQPA